MDTRTPEPYWLIRNGLLHVFPSLQADQECDILIVGGGITGALVMDALLQEGYNVIMADKADIGNGSTAATTAMLQYEIDVPLVKLREITGREAADHCYIACRDAIYELQELAQKYEIDCGFEKKQSLYFAHDRRAATRLQAELEARKAAGLDVSWLGEKEVMERFAIKTTGAILSKDGASIDPYFLTKELIHYHREKGVRIFDKTPLKKIRHDDKDITAISENGHAIHAKNVIYCTGYESQEHLGQKVVKLLSTYACVSEQAPQLKDEWNNTLIWNTADPYLYMRTTDDGRLLTGGADQPFKNAGLRDSLLYKMEGRLKKEFRKYTALPEFVTDHIWAGTFGSTKDGLPYIGKAPDQENSYYVLGFGGNGILFSMLGRKIIVDALQGKTSLLAHLFRFGR